MTSAGTRDRPPILSWLVLTTLDHPWQAWLIEHLLDNSLPAGLTECVILGMQDRDFCARAKEVATRIVQNLKFIPGVLERWQYVRFEESWSENFNVAAGRNLLLNKAQGDIVVFPDADVRPTRSQFAAFAIYSLMCGRLGLLGFPSLHRGRQFKPELGLPTMPHPSFAGVRLASSVNGMVTVLPAAVARLLGGQNPALSQWGEYTALSTKVAQAGLFIGYASPRNFWLTTTRGRNEAFSLTRGPRSHFHRSVGIGLLNNFYEVNEEDLFWRIQHSRYAVYDERRSFDVAAEIGRRADLFRRHQLLSEDAWRFPFKPWDCLSHKSTPEYLAEAWDRAEPFFKPIEDLLRDLGLGHLCETRTRSSA